MDVIKQSTHANWQWHHPINPRASGLFLACYRSLVQTSHFFLFFFYCLYSKAISSSETIFPFIWRQMLFLLMFLQLLPNMTLVVLAEMQCCTWTACHLPTTDPKAHGPSHASQHSGGKQVILQIFNRQEEFKFCLVWKILMGLECLPFGNGPCTFTSQLFFLLET